MRIDLSLAHREAAEKFIAEQKDPSSTNYHQWLKPGEFDRRFGPDPATRTSIVAWLKTQGFQVTKSANSNAINFTGTIAQAQRAFNVEIYATESGKHYGNLGDPTVPAQFANSIAFIDGLDNLRGANSTMHISPGSPADPSAAKTDTKLKGLTGFGPSDFYTFYDVNPILNSVTGTGGGCIGLLEVSDYSDTGIVNFDSTFNLATANITRVVSPDSDNPGVNNRQGESMLDIEYAHAFAPGAAISVYLTDPATFGGNTIEASVDSLNTAVNDDTCSALSLSIESCGFPASYYTGTLHQTYMKAAAQNQTVFIAEGDEGAAEFDVDMSTGTCVVGTTRNVNELASDPLVTAIGGTQFTPNYDAKGNDVGFVPESVWNEPQFLPQGIGSGGGGASTVWVGQKPSYQALGTPADNTRDVPDISMEAACSNPGAFSVFPDQATGNNVSCCACGTSIGAPIWAGIAELMIQTNGNKRIGTINPELYKLGNLQNTAASGIRDTTIGNNDFNGVTGFNAVPGFDLATGWGTPDVAVFIDAYFGITAPPTPTTVTAKPTKLNFSKIDATATSKTKKLTLDNKGTAAAMIGLISPPASFTVSNDTCSNTTVNPKGKCTVELTFAPATPASVSEILSIPYNGTSPSVTLEGTGLAVSLSAPKSVTAPAVAAGSVGKAKKITIDNKSSATVQVGAASLSANFETASDTCAGTSLAPKGKCVVMLEFAPGTGTSGTLTGTLGYSFTYGANVGVPVSIALKGKVK